MDLFPETQISFDVDGSSKAAMVEGLLDLALLSQPVDGQARKSLLKAVLKREKAGSTGVGRVAIPHIKTPLIQQTMAAVGVFPGGVDFDAVDGELVHCVFLLISPTVAAEEHVQALRWIAGMARKPDYTRFVRQTRSAEEVRGLLEELGAP